MSAVEERVSVSRSAFARDFRRGFVTTAALWTGNVPFALAYAALAREAGFSLLETQALSLFVFAGSSQLAIINLVSAGAGFVSVILTTTVINLRHVLYGLSLDKLWPRRTRPPRPVLAFLLVDESYGLTIKDKLESGGGSAFFFGSGLSMFLSFNVATFVGALAGGKLADATDLGLEFIFPLTFLLLLLPLLRSRADYAVAALSTIFVLLLDGRVNSGAALLISVLIAISLGSLIADRRIAR
jgi:4-azaleucine resistance transporter AzlC